MLYVIKYMMIVSFFFMSLPAVSEEKNTVILQALDKVTARVSTFEAKIGQTVEFGTLTITMHHCDRTPPEEPPESTAFIEIFENKRDEKSRNVFLGWMFASSPALSGMEHPVYDIWVLDCTSLE